MSIDKPKNSLLSGISWAGAWALRLQICLIYLTSSVAKLLVPAWQQGSEMYYVTRMEYFGSAGLAGGFIRSMMSVPSITLALSWGSIALEFSVAIFVMFRRDKLDLVSLVAVAMLHVGIVLVIGLFSFGTIMIGSVLCAVAPGIWNLYRQNERFGGRFSSRTAFRNLETV